MQATEGRADARAGPSIQGEVAKLMDDMGRFREPVPDLQRHSGEANEELEKIFTSSEKIAQRGRKIENLDFDEATPAPRSSSVRVRRAPPPPALAAAGTGRRSRGENGGPRGSASRTCWPGEAPRWRPRSRSAHMLDSDPGRRRNQPGQSHHPCRAARGVAWTVSGFGERFIRPTSCNTPW